MTINFEELAALEAVGALDAAEAEAFERALADAPAAVRADVREMRELMAAAAAVSSVLEAPAPHVKDRLLARLGIGGAPPPVPEGFAFKFASDESWIPHAVPGIRLKMLSVNRERGYATLLMDVAPGARFPPHHHGGAEECYVISGSVVACGRRLVAGDFHHADAGSDHDELWTDEGCRVLLVVDPRDYMPQPSR
jgi:quercetin dioxygenase-like cupin family protein